MRFDGCNQLLETDTRQKDHRPNLTGHHSIGEIEGFFVLVDRYFTHRRANEWQAAEALNQPRKVIATSAFQGCNSESTKGWAEGRRYGCLCDYEPRALAVGISAKVSRGVISAIVSCGVISAIVSLGR